MRPSAIMLAILVWAGSALAGEATTPPKLSEQPSKADLKIIAVMDILQLMDLMESIDIIKDMDVLIEGNQNENQN